MPVTGKLLADFESFFDAVDKSESKLVSFEAGAAKVENRLNAMTDGFSGRRLIQEATVMAEAVERAGGTSKLTASELERVSRSAGEAAAKMKLMGIDVPPAIQNLASAAGEARVEHEKMLDAVGRAGGRIEGLKPAAEGARSSVGSLTGIYRQFDGVLQAAGINIGPQVKGLEDIANAASGSASKIGLLGTAGLALGTGIAAWGITRAAMDFLGLDKHVEAAWKQILRFGDVAQETAGAKLDTINRAIANGAAATISYTDAIKFNIEAAQKNADAKINWTAKLAEAWRQVRNLTDSQVQEIAIAQQAGASTEQLTAKYGTNATALRLLAEQNKLTAQAADEHRQKIEALNNAYAKLMSDTKNANQLALMEEEAAAMERRIEQEKLFFDLETKARINRQQAIKEQASAEAAAEAARVDANQREIDALLAAGQAHTEAGAVAKQATDQTIAGYAGVAQQITITGDAIKEWLTLMRYTAQANAIIKSGSGLFTTQSQLERIANIPGFASGVENFQGGLARVHRDELLVNLPKGTDVIPAGRGGGPTNLSVHLTVQGSVISTFEEFKALAAAGVRDALVGLGLPVAAGA